MAETPVRPDNVDEMLSHARKLRDAISRFRDQFADQYTARAYRIPHYDGLMNPADLKNALWTLDCLVEYWQDESRTYTPPEQILDQRLDCQTERREAAPTTGTSVPNEGT